MAEVPAASFLLIDELFAAGDPRFLPALRNYHDPASFATFAARWLRDPRPWAREQLFSYLDQPLSAVNHNSLVKRLFKGAEAAKDDELMAAFAVAFDRLVRRVRRWADALRSPIDRVHLVPASRLWNPQTQAVIEVGPYHVVGKHLFSYRTRYYLRRRVWRYFRRMGHQQPQCYVPAIVAMLARYRDEDLAAGENVLDSWSLMHACFAKHPAVSFLTHRAVLAAGTALADLRAAPDHPKLWQDPAAGRPLFSLVTAAQSHLVRFWAVQLLRESHLESLRGLTLADLSPLLAHVDEQVQLFGAELLESATGLQDVPFEQWLVLLQTKSLATLEAVASAMRRNLDPAKLTLFDAARLACQAPAPVARLGLYFLQQQPIETPQARQALTNLADAKSVALGQEIAAWALSILGRPEHYDVNQVTRFFDSLLLEIREGARAWLTPASAGWNDPALWSRLIESPYDDLRLKLIAILEERTKSAAAAHREVREVLSPADLAPLWMSTLLNIHRGGRNKLTALRQISGAIKDHPEAAERLLPVLAVAIRSVRAPEARAGLASIVSAVAERPELQQSLERVLPEMKIMADAV